ncbi:Gx transporter family protein [Konateibacter massiliensis]|uniref:Gx transporter family protein n=1 Tax=Konateibacter massiliensis TaxID=2002841 RepID=UPI000C148A82|nr:Gx transporter family protein [Konateibacter massiliensis]
MKSKRIAVYGMLIALAFILSYIESMIPIPIPIPGIKLGLANLVVLVGLYTMGAKEAFVLSMIRIILVGFTFGNLSTMMFSFAGGMLSWLLMCLFYKSKKFSITGISVIGGISHNVGQILMGIWVVDSAALLYYLPFLLISGAVTGIVIGMVGAILVKRIKSVSKDV